MKKATWLFLALLVVLTVGLVAQEPDPKPGPSLDPTVVEALLVILAGGLVTMATQVLKNLLKVTGVLAKVLTGVIGVVVVAVYFLFMHPPFDVLTFALYALVIFGEATGWYHLYKRPVA